MKIANDGLRFLLELAALGIAGWWGWTLGDGVTRWALALGIPLAMVTVWGVFRVPHDPGKGLVAVPGPARLGIEAVFFGIAVLALRELAGNVWAALLLAVLLAHYALAWERVKWLASPTPAIPARTSRDYSPGLPENHDAEG